MAVPLKSWTIFRCESPDFIVRSALDDTSFAVSRTSLHNSAVFRDMFLFGQVGTSTTDENQVVDLHETSAALIVLLNLLHYPLQSPVFQDSDTVSEEAQSSRLPTRAYDPTTVIPLPILLSLLYSLVDKYALSDLIAEKLDAHLLAHAPTDPLQVYGFAVSRRLDKVASEASQYIMPIASYQSNEIQCIPNVIAYHKIVRLQDLRVKALRDLVYGENIFPHGYGICPSHHQETNACWEAKRAALMPRIEAGEMNTVKHALPTDCKACHKACTAAVMMLAYKSRKTLRRIDQLPAEA